MWGFIELGKKIQQRKAALTENGLSRKQQGEYGRPGECILRGQHRQWVTGDAARERAGCCSSLQSPLSPTPPHPRPRNTHPSSSWRVLPLPSHQSAITGFSALSPAGSQVLWGDVLWQWQSSPSSNHALREPGQPTRPAHLYLWKLTPLAHWEDKDDSNVKMKSSCLYRPPIFIQF